MTVMQILNPKITWRGFGAGCALFVLALVLYEWLGDPFGRRAIAASLRLGMTDAEVVQALGEGPAYAYDRATAPDDYYVKGWSHKKRPITHRVLIFKLGEPICYVWLDQSGLVEDFFVGGS